MFVHPLCGFSASLNWRPIFFQEPLPATRTCSVCDVVPQTTLLLPCGHFVCQYCLDGAVSRRSVCPLDGESFLGEFVPPLKFTERQMAKYKAHCWNVVGGCDFVGSVTNLLGHYNEECVFHTVSCSRCKRTVLRRDIAEHWAADCNTLAAVPHEDRVSRCLSDVRSALEKLSSDNTILQSTFNELLEEIRSVSASIKLTVTSAAASLSKECDEKAAHILDKQKQLQRMLANIEISVRQPSDSEATGAASDRVAASLETAGRTTRPIYCGHSFHWYFDEWSELKTDALEGRSVDLDSDATYVQGYRMFLNAGLRYRKNELHFGLFLVIANGRQKVAPEWPFRKKYKLSIIHPTLPSKTISRSIDFRRNSEGGSLNARGGCSTVSYGCSNIATPAVIERQGLVTNDTLHLCVEIDP